MRWWEFTKDNGDGSYSKMRYRTKEEAEKAQEWFDNNCSWWQGDGDGITEIDTDEAYFFNTLEKHKEDYGIV